MTSQAPPAAVAAPPTFRDFAGQIFAGDATAAQTTLAALLGLSVAEAAAATAYFQSQTADPTFLPKAMALRTVVAGADDAAVAEHLQGCFGLSTESAQAATVALRRLYPITDS
jgi:hypothetical protein